MERNNLIKHQPKPSEMQKPVFSLINKISITTTGITNNNNIIITFWAVGKLRSPLENLTANYNSKRLTNYNIKGNKPCYYSAY